MIEKEFKEDYQKFVREFMILWQVEENQINKLFKKITGYFIGNFVEKPSSYRSSRWDWGPPVELRFLLTNLAPLAVSPQRPTSSSSLGPQNPAWLAPGLIISTDAPQGLAVSACPFPPFPSIRWRRGTVSVPSKTEVSSISETIWELILISVLLGPQGPRRARKKQIGDPQASTNKLHHNLLM